MGACLSAQAQATTDTPTTGALSPALSLQRARYVAAHDSLMRLAAGVRDRLELLEYPAAVGAAATSQWLLVRGGYLRHDRSAGAPQGTLSGARSYPLKSRYTSIPGPLGRGSSPR